MQAGEHKACVVAKAHSPEPTGTKIDWLASVAVVSGSLCSLLLLTMLPHCTLGLGDPASCCSLAGLCEHARGMAGQSTNS